MSGTEWVKPIVLKRERIVLRPLAIEDAVELHPICPGETFDYFVSLRPADATFEAFENYILARMAAPNMLSFVILADDKVVGETAYMDIRDDAKGLEIGLTWYCLQVRGTWVNPLCKLILLEHALEVLGAIRVQLKTDGRNLHSQAAIKKLGATYEGTLRKHGIQSNGFERDTVMFSIIQEDWPRVKQNLEERLKQLSNRP